MAHTITITVPPCTCNGNKFITPAQRKTAEVYGISEDEAHALSDHNLAILMATIYEEMTKEHGQ